VALPIHAANEDHTLGVCIWEGGSVDAVREGGVEGAVGAWANNEYFRDARRWAHTATRIATGATLLEAKTIVDRL